MKSITVDIESRWNSEADSNRRLIIAVAPKRPALTSAAYVSGPRAGTVDSDFVSGSASAVTTDEIELYQIHVSTLILKSRSEYFRAMLDSKFVESQETRNIRLIVTSEIEGRALYVLLYSLYTNDVFGEINMEDAKKSNALGSGSDELKIDSVDADFSVPVKNDVVQSLDYAGILALIQLADCYQTLPALAPLLLPVLRGFLEARTSFFSELYQLPESLLQNSFPEAILALMRSKLISHFKSFWKCCWTNNRSLWTSLPAAALMDLISSPDIEIDTEANVLDVVRCWIDERWKEVGGVGNDEAVKVMNSSPVITLHSSLLKKVQWLQLPKLYLLHAVLPLFEVNASFSHLSSFRPTVHDVLAVLMSGQSIASLPPCGCASTACLRSLYSHMNGRRLKNKSATVRPLNFLGANDLHQCVSPFDSKSVEILRLILGVQQLECWLFIQGQNQFHLMFHIPVENQTPHYVMEVKIRIFIWNFQTSCFDSLQSRPSVVKSGQPINILQGDKAAELRITNKTATELVTEGVYVREGQMKLNLEFNYEH